MPDNLVISLQRTPQRRICPTWSLRWRWWRWSANTRTSSTWWEPALRMVSLLCFMSITGDFVNDLEADSALCCLPRTAVCGGGVRLAGKPKGVSPVSATAGSWILERLQTVVTGQLGGQGAGVLCLPGGQRNVLPGFKEGQSAENDVVQWGC